MMMNSTDKNRLVEIPAGRYVRAGSDGAGFKDIAEATQGVIVKRVEGEDHRQDFHTVLVDGDLINCWVPKSDE